jgi:uncharacterized membrane protein (UPF0136 family)
MIEALSSQRSRVTTVVILAIAAVLAAAAGIVGISDNPPGILLAFGAAAALVLAFVHPWRTSRQFRYLFYAVFVGIAVLVVVHNVFEVVAGRMGGPGFVVAVLQGVQVAAFLIAVLICPPALVIGAVGAVVMAIRNRRRPELP